MSARYAISVLLLLGLAACQKDPAPSQPGPVAKFAFADNTASDVLTVATYDNVYLTDQSVNAVGYRWDYGNDSLRTTSNPSFYYTKPGTYTLTLTVQNANKQTATVSKQIRVLDRVIKQVAIVDLSDRVGSPMHNLVNPTYWVVLRVGENHANYPMQSLANPSFNAPIVYESQKVTGLTSASLPYVFTVPGKLLVDFPALNYYPFGTKLGYTGVGYGLELYGQDATGTYLLSTSYMPYYQSQSGGIGRVGTNIQQNIFTAVYGDVRLIGDFE
ncbi:PKD domain-containing protein [Hymenobacter sp. BRD67]|uniref:PKD domain-containing protein n=1 Tax=Hymenobacter sp. BRD67 TaxID=2675877 RepID=UPI001565F7E2|nr:PKD domain-containing protein [Hymenobacter sp. BRD67]QKG52287.1 PKD domain-containing protein [Hymenobacter sp. BRD67]